MASELKLCPNPWCRYDSEPVVVASQVHLDYGVSIRHTCGIMGPQADSEEEAISAWNTRPVEDALLEALKKLRDCDWIISLPDRMDAVRGIARAALKRSDDVQYHAGSSRVLARTRGVMQRMSK